ncbi:hypothetical protein H2201_008454 [Coniosporium apollinis]|uniref:EKC/KEOPS complex subunit GON7 n=1 Tax=Coniosporium apollinis TaxID=61459 RepID=A0ABQ9NIP1_9PEZI|nr:hypothetical protein H2201_008454 [Coniosporium apollinis]
MGNTNSPQNANLYTTAFTQTIPKNVRETLIHGLNLNGSVDEPMVQPTYSPAMLTKAINNTPIDSEEDKVKAVAAVLKYLRMIERNIRKIEKVVESQEFKSNPNVLEKE